MKNLPWLTSIDPEDTFDSLLAALPNAAHSTFFEGDEMVIDERAIETRFGTRANPSNESLTVEFDDGGGIVFAELIRPFTTVRIAKSQAIKIGQKLIDQRFALDGLERSQPTFRTTFHDARLRQFQTWIVGEYQSVDVIVWSYPKDADFYRAFVSVATHMHTSAEGQQPRPGSASYSRNAGTWLGWEDVGPGEGVHIRNRAYHAAMTSPTAEEWAAIRRPEYLDEPTMDDVLASIREVIFEDAAGTENAGA